jgi:hypothetical protein
MLELPEITLSHVLKFFHTLYAQAYQQNALQRGLVIGGNAETHDCAGSQKVYHVQFGERPQAGSFE